MWVLGSACFLAGAWWATRPKEDPERDEDQEDSLSLAVGRSSFQSEPTGANSVKIVEKGQREPRLADPCEPPTLEELLDQFEQIFSPKLMEDQRRRE
jgi:hypothetical protein